MIDEPGFSGVMEPGFPVPPDTAIDLVSGALAVIERCAVMGVHCCAEGDWAAITATGPTILSVPAEAALVDAAGVFERVPRGWGLDRLGRGTHRSTRRDELGPPLALLVQPVEGVGAPGLRRGAPPQPGDGDAGLWPRAVRRRSGAGGAASHERGCGAGR